MNASALAAPTSGYGRVNPGPMPRIAMVPKSQLRVDRSYQRALSEKRSEQLIAQLAANFRWAHCGPLIVTANGDRTFNVIDGQHRLEAAKRLRQIDKLPCYIVDAVTLKQQAAAFVAHNHARVHVSSQALYHASVMAGSEPHVRVAQICAQAGVTIARSPLTVQAMAPGETIATGVLLHLVRAGDDEELLSALTCLRKAYPKTPGQLRSRSIAAVATLIADGVSETDLVKALRATDGQQLEDAARAARAKSGRTIAAEFILVLRGLCQGNLCQAGAT